MALYYLVQGKTLVDHLRELFDTFGWYREALVSRGFKGQEGMEKMKKIMEALRNTPPSRIGNLSVLKIKDYLAGIEKDPKGTIIGSIELPRSNVLQFFLEDGSILSARPSGTEPKIKFYISCCTAPHTTEADAEVELGKKIASLKKFVEQLFPT
jgi:phosphoglucomutase